MIILVTPHTFKGSSFLPTTGVKASAPGHHAHTTTASVCGEAPRVETQQHELSLALSGLSHRRGHVLRSFVTSVGPLCFSTLGSTTLGRPLKCGVAARVRAGIAITPPQYHCAAAAVQLYKQYYHTRNTRRGCSDVLSHASFITPLIYHTSEHALWVFGRAITPRGLPHLLRGTCELLFITGGTQDTTPPRDTIPGGCVCKAQNVITGVCYLVSYTVIGQTVCLFSFFNLLLPPTSPD